MVLKALLALRLEINNSDKPNERKINKQISSFQDGELLFFYNVENC